MKRLLFLLIAIVVAVATLDYAHSPGHYGLIIVAGLAAVLLMIRKSVG
ncbi:hypothetical protein ACFXHA_04495 [Nocardia sp. NPDC059240]